jgi:uncharacterized phage protein (TIGR01671 family)
MRERKYRAWNTETGKMIDLQNVTPLALDPTLVALGTQGVFLPFQPHIVIMDYVGAQDCNGVDIYESDLVRIEHASMLITSGTIGVVNYACGRYVIDTHTHTHGLNLFVDRRYRRYAKPVIEVVGNLYEHPELAPKK